MSKHRKRVARRLAEELISSAEVDHELKRAVVAQAAYKTPDGRHIVMDWGDNFFEYSEQGRTEALEFAALVQERSRDEPSETSMTDGYDIGADFPQRVDDWCGKLVAMCGIKLDFSDEEKSYVESYVRRRRKRFLQRGWFEPLLAYCLKRAQVMSGGAIVALDPRTGEVYPHVVINHDERNVLKLVYEGLQEGGFEIVY